MIRQVRLKEIIRDANGNLSEPLDEVFAFGTHPQVTSDEQAHPVTSAKAINNKLRIIMDELLVGNYIEEIGCRGQVDNDSYAVVPIGSTPDDIARCSVAKDVLPSSCPGSNQHSVCICTLDTGCGETPKGGPVGVLDINQDGAADDTRMMPDVVGLQCGSVKVPIDLNNSYWNPSGDQNVPAMGGFDALGPAIVLVPSPPPGGTMGTPQFLPTNTECQLTFSPTVVDKQNNGVCAPPSGDVTKACSPGELGNFKFTVEPLAVSNSGVQNGDTGVSRTGTIDITLTAPPAPGSLTAITVKEGATNYTQFTATLPFPQQIRLTWTGATGLAANTMYTITIGTGVTDLYNQAVPTPVNYTFTTGS